MGQYYEYALRYSVGVLFCQWVRLGDVECHVLCGGEIALLNVRAQGGAEGHPSSRGSIGPLPIFLSWLNKHMHKPAKVISTRQHCVIFVGIATGCHHCHLHKSHLTYVWFCICLVNTLAEIRIFRTAFGFFPCSIPYVL